MKRTDMGLLVLRAGFALLMLGHGVGKFLDLMQGKGGNFPDPLGVGSTVSLGLAVLGEFVCPLLILAGYRTRLFAIPTLVTMLVAAVLFHRGDPFAERELAVVYAVGFLAIAILGGGGLSLDGVLGKKRR